MAGPGVLNTGMSQSVWSDHTDIRPTILSLVGLHDDYQSQGRVLSENLHPWALADGIQDNGNNFTNLARAYKRINAPVGDLGLATLKISTAALAGDDATYNNLENRLRLITAHRDALASRMLDALTDAEFHGKQVNSEQAWFLILQANALVDYVNELASNPNKDH
jgi:hypothetical protein